MKLLALDLGDAWVGSAISDPMGITCKPFQTVTPSELDAFLAKTLSSEFISTVVVGYPKTVSSGGESEQTKKIVELFEQLKQRFASVASRDISWVLWDERLSSKRADGLHKGIKSKEEKIKSHSIAAAFILQSYLDHQAFKRDW